MRIRNKKMISVALSSATLAFALPTMPIVSASNIMVQAQNGLALSLSGQSWGSSYGVNAALKNTTGKVIEDWKIIISSKVDIDNIWSAKAVIENGKTVITPMEWNKTIKSNGDIQFGYIGIGNYDSNIDYTTYYKIGGVWTHEAITNLDNNTKPIDTKNDSVILNNKVNVVCNGSGWGTGYSLTVNIANSENYNIEDWKLTIPSSQVDINSIWCATVTKNNDLLFITPLGYNQQINSKQSVSFGFIGKGEYPSNIKTNLEYKINGKWYNAKSKVEDNKVDPIENPSTEIPATQVPATQVPATQVPATQVPATQVPATQVPATQVPATQVPATQVPATQVPATQVPATQVPTSEDAPTVSSDASIKSITVKGISAIKKTTTTYEVDLPKEVKLTDVRSTDFVVKTTDKKATVTSAKYTASTGVAAIAVKAEDGTVIIYTISLKETRTNAETTTPLVNDKQSKFGKEVHGGDATFYGAGPGGCCNMDDYEDLYYTVAMNRPDFNEYNLAGAYLEVTDKDGDKINVLVTNELPEGKPGDLDLSISAFDAIEPLETGRMKCTWKIIPFPTNKPIAYKYKPSSSQFWAEVQVREQRYPLKSVEYLSPNGEWIKLERKPYNYYCAPRGMGSAGPYTFRVTDMYGHVLIDENVPLDTTEKVIPGKANFPY